MPDFRMAVFLPDEAGVAAIAARLHNATVVRCDDIGRGSPNGCDAILLAGPVETAQIDRILSLKVHVLLVAHTDSPRDALERLFHRARTHGVQLSVANPDRFLPSRQLIRKQLAALGEPGLIRSHRWETSAEEADIPGVVIRDLDTILWLAARQPDRVFALQSPAGDSRGRFIQVHLGFPHGGMALLDYTDRLPAGNGYQSLSLIAAYGAAYADDHQNMQLLFRGGNATAIRTEELAGQLAAMAQEFVDGLMAGRDLTACEADWRATFAVADAVRESLASGRAVALEGR